jgi:DNA recombination protein RmuC
MNALLQLTPLSGFLLGLLVGLLLTSCLLLWRLSHRVALARRAGGAARDAEIAQLETERDGSRTAQSLLSAEREKLQRITERDEISVRTLIDERATLKARLERLPPLTQELQDARDELARLRQSHESSEQRATALATRLEEQTAATQDKLGLLDTARELMSASFKSLANDILEDKSKKFTEQNSLQLGQLLTPLREQISDFRKIVTDTHIKENADRAVLQHEIGTLQKLNLRISEDAINLTKALKGESKTQGAWGELILERLLESSGLQKGIEYETQVTLADDSGGRSRPDVIVRLPERRDLIIDAKVSLTAYERFCAAVDDAERALQIRAHCQSMRGHVNDLATRKYNDLPGINSLDFVLMFVPVEAAYIEAMRNDDTLYQAAVEKHVLIVSTSTLLVTLRTVNSLWRFDDRNRNALEIANKAGALYDKFSGFVEDLGKVRNGLDSAQRSLGDATSKLSEGKGNLVRRVEELRKLGAKASKSLPADLLEKSEADLLLPLVAEDHEPNPDTPASLLGNNP